MPERRPLEQYRARRDFRRTPEPRPGSSGEGSAAARFVVQRHEARRLHYDLRLGMDGVLKSFAVPRGFSFVPGDRHLAVRTEDHPLDYLEFEGVIPKGQYGAGTMTLFDRGSYELRDAADGLEPCRSRPVPIFSPRRSVVILERVTVDTRESEALFSAAHTERSMYGQPTNWKRRFIVIGVLAVIAGFFLADPIRRSFASREFTPEQVRKYEHYFEGWSAPLPPGEFPARSGKVVVIRPSTQQVYMTATTFPLQWTSIAPEKRPKIAREERPPRIHAAQFYLDDAIRAAAPGEVDTVILVHARKRAKREDDETSTDRSPWDDYMNETVLLVYDRRSRRFLGGYVMAGSSPPSQEEALGKEIAEVVAQMPLRGR